ncbi:hypothetical protein F0U44_09495 [Nocardioides humilatus]|uniref:Zinc-finger domain-containing protein n=1 Tax=Nocardioides humilatus TaxID=2607660 RepID=A0A5B1LGA2_9ACTN|nr:hypothetical protein [Nocardioides humilatus]KAA1418719.1 hypothetical protein F0U44_09495 [Nocardioides humilatus]
MIGHLGARVSALLDGQLSAAEAEEAWNHVYACHACRDLVEREGWVKTRLAGLSCGDGSASSDLKGSLLSLTPGERILAEASHGGSTIRRGVGVAVLGGGALGAAMVGVLALGLGSGTPPVNRPPASRIETPAASDDTDETNDRTQVVTPVRMTNPAATLDGFGAQPLSAAVAVPAWVRHWLP